MTNLVTISPRVIGVQISGPGIQPRTLNVARGSAISYAFVGTQGPAGAFVAAQSPLVAVPFSFGDASPAVVLSISAAQYIAAASIVINVPFNGAGAALSLGIVGAPQLLIAAAQVDPASAYEYETNPNVSVGSNIILTITPGAGATQGSGVVLLEKIPTS